MTNRTLNALSRSGIKLDDLPRLYKEGLLDKIVGIGKKGIEEITKYAKENLEIKSTSDLLYLDYSQIIDYLLNKYGKPEGSYFRTESCSTVNPKISRASEGLQIHHIRENEIELLSLKDVAKEYPFEYQKELVYCNLLEHFILHIKIFEDTGLSKNGCSYLNNTIIDLYNSYFNGYELKTSRAVNSLNAIKNDFFEYRSIMRYTWHLRLDLFKRCIYILL